MGRYARQERLREVGAEGQARIGRAAVDVPGTGLAGEVAARYLAGAGVAALRVREAGAGEAARAVDARAAVTVVPSGERDVAEGAPAPGFAPGPAREVAEGALTALAALRAALEAE